MSKPKNKTHHLSFNRNMNRFLMCDICVITITILWQCTRISPKTEIKHTSHAAHLHECIYNSTNKNTVFNEAKQSHFWVSKLPKCVKLLNTHSGFESFPTIFFLHYFCVCISIFFMQTPIAAIDNDCGESAVQPDLYSSETNRGCSLFFRSVETSIYSSSDPKSDRLNRAGNSARIDGSCGCSVLSDRTFPKTRNLRFL